MEDLANDVVITDSSKGTNGSIGGYGYDIKTYPSNTPSLFAKLRGLGVTGTQLISVLSYLYQVSKIAGQSESTLPRLFAAAQCVELFPIVSDLVVSLSGQLLCQNAVRPKRRLLGDTVPSVDVIITTCKEDVEVVMDTVRAAATLDWPFEKLRILVSDDGLDEELRAQISQFKKKYTHVHYYSRPKNPGKHHGFKAGNMNQAARYLGSDAFDQRPASYIAILDADMIPDKAWLRALVPHLLLDHEIGMITIPQDFFNIPVNDPLHENLILQHEAEQSLRDRMGAAWCPGSGFVFDRAAWEKVGGFSETSMCDDVLFGWTLNGKGYKTAAISERLQSGEQPSTFADHIKQRRRWTIGGMRNARELGYGTNTKLLGNSSAWQKLAAFNQLPKPFIGTIGKAFVWFVVFLALALGQPVLGSCSISDIAVMLRSYAVFMVSTRISEYTLAMSYGIQNIRRRQIIATWQGMHLAKACVQELIPAWLGGSSLGFLVTGIRNASTIELEERNENQRPGMIERIRRLHAIEGVLNHLWLFVVMASLLGYQVFSLYQVCQPKDILPVLVASVLFPGLRLENLIAFLSPVWYIMFPPTEKPREKRLTEDLETGFRRPIVWERGATFTRGMYVWELWYLSATAWAVYAAYVAAEAAGFFQQV